VEPSEVGQRHLILVGLPGSGKTTAGRAAAELAGRRFLDFDEEIERRQGKSVTQIFASEGEPVFRRLERELTAEIANQPAMVVSPGGGWVTNRESVALIRPRAKLVYLKLTPRTALARLGAGRSTRPLLMRPDPLGELSRLLGERGDLYELSDVVIDVELLSLQRVIELIIQLT
jgi:shikimate kinase